MKLYYRNQLSWFTIHEIPFLLCSRQKKPTNQPLPSHFRLFSFKLSVSELLSSYFSSHFSDDITSGSVMGLWISDCIPAPNSLLSSGPVENFMTLFQGLRWMVSLCRPSLPLCSSLPLLVWGIWHNCLLNDFQAWSVVQTFLHLNPQAYSIQPPNNKSDMQEKTVRSQNPALASIMLFSSSVLCRKCSYLLCSE